LHHAELHAGRHTVQLTLLVTASLLPYAESPRVLLILENVTSLLKQRSPDPTSQRVARPAHAG
jgi:hypothetical protein